MRLMRVVVAAVLVAAALEVTAVSSPAGGAAPKVEVLLSGLSSPKALSLTTIEPQGNPLVGQGAFGPPGPVLAYRLHKPDRGTAVPVSEPFNIIDLATNDDGTVWAIGGDAVLYLATPDGTITPVLNIPDYQVTDPDPEDQEGVPDESNPYGLTSLPNGDALVADAANNDLLRVTQAGDVTTMARFGTEVVPTDHIPGFPEPTVTAEAVPTSVAVGKDGGVYVGELQGFPFRPGTSDIWRIEPDADGALCSLTTPDPDCQHFAGGFTAIEDIAWNKRNGKLYVYELAADGVLAFEAGFETGQFPPAVLLEVSNKKRRELAAGLLSQPGGVIVGKNGDVFVTDGMFGDGRLLEVHH
jgi:hypothetical protein